jgi:D-glycero-alpha-D-manno-heptose-7-phosphate kinase
VRAGPSLAGAPFFDCRMRRGDKHQPYTVWFPNLPSWNSILLHESGKAITLGLLDSWTFGLFPRRMIITRSPLRISLGGGGTDLPSYYREHTGFLIAAAIDKYVYITLHRTFVSDLIVKYSKLERVRTVDELEHPIIREAMKLAGVSAPNLEITAMADIPSGTGLGSSGSFTTALLKALHTWKKNLVTAAELAEQACTIELDRLREPVGKQDQYIAAVGGITVFTFRPDGRVDYRPAAVTEETLFNLEDNLLLFFTGYSRSASTMLRDQVERSQQRDRTMLEHLHATKELGQQSLAALENGRLEEFARLMDVHWQRKRARSSGMSNGKIDQWYDHGMANGALGGKLIGAGGGGFLMFYAGDKPRLRHAMREKGLQEVRFRFDFEGTKVVVQH